MARNLYQTSQKISIPREEFLHAIVYNDSLSKSELRVINLLLTELEGWSPTPSGKGDDPGNFKAINVAQISRQLSIKKKKISKILARLCMLGIIEKGDSITVETGYRFMF